MLFVAYRKALLLGVGQATGAVKTPYTAINEDPEAYMHPDYLPPDRDEGFCSKKPNEMKLLHLQLWIEHLYNRQERKRLGHLTGPVFEFKKDNPKNRKVSHEGKRES